MIGTHSSTVASKRACGYFRVSTSRQVGEHHKKVLGYSDDEYVIWRRRPTLAWTMTRPSPNGSSLGFLPLDPLGAVRL